jgi:hypothetical protein
MTDRKAMEQALEALELLARCEHPLTKIQVRKPRDGGSIVTVYPHQVATDAAEPLRERLAQPEQEPKHYPHTWGKDGERCVVCGDKDWMGTSCKKISVPQPEQCRYPDCKCATENLCLKGLEQPQRTHWEGCEEVHPECRKPEQEPVAHVYLFEPNGRPRVAWDNANGIKIGDKLYTSPPQRQWVGLTDAEIAEWDYDVRDVVMDIEKLLREKNT